MTPDLTLEAIYINTPTDFKMEIMLTGACNTRFLNASVSNSKGFLLALQKSVSRSRAIITVGGFDEDFNLAKLMARATNIELAEINNSDLGIKDEKLYLMPQGMIPLVASDGKFMGGVLEKGDQAIIMVDSDIEHRYEVIESLVVPYLKFLVDKKQGLKTEKPINPIRHEKGLHDKEDINIVPEDNYVGKHSKKEEAIPEAVIEPANKKSEKVFFKPKESDTEKILEDETHDGYKVLEVPTELDTLDELSFEVRPDSKKRRIIKAIIAVILVAAVILGSFFGYKYLYQPMQGDSIYESIVSLFGIPAKSKTPEFMLNEFGRLYEMNKNVAGFITVPNTNINYPIVSTNAAGSVYCDSHLFDGTFNSYGTPYTFAKIGNTSYNRNIVIYGKSVRNGKMFSNLINYCDLSFYRSAPVISFDSILQKGKYKVFSVLRFQSLGIDYKRTVFFDDDDFFKHMEKIRKASEITTSVDIKGTDQVITLVTKSNKTTIAVFARAVRMGESLEVDVTDSNVNNNAGIVSNDVGSSSYTGEISAISESYKQSTENFEQSEVTSIEIIRAKPFVSSTPTSSTVSSSHSSKISSKASVTSAAPSKVSSYPPSSAVSSSTLNLPILTVTNSSTGNKEQGTTLDIIARIVEAEMGSSYQVEALKAQAVTSYGWLLCNGAASGKYPSTPMKAASSKVINAVKEVLGVVATYKGNVACTYCYDTSAGFTADYSSIWNGSPYGSGTSAYLKAVDSSVDKNNKNYQTTRTYSAADIAKWIKTVYSVDLLSYNTDRTKWFSLTYDSNNCYVKNMKIGSSKNIKGSELRSKVLNDTNCGSKNGIRSSAFTISYNEAKDTFTFTVRGYGHGVGLSQYGANEYAKAGKTYDWIIKHYFTGVELGTYFI